MPSEAPWRSGCAGGPPRPGGAGHPRVVRGRTRRGHTGRRLPSRHPWSSSPRHQLGGRGGCGPGVAAAPGSPAAQRESEAPWVHIFWLGALCSRRQWSLGRRG
eukprot:8952694-Pyramimonas_sp.AAC.1